jgi:hypothetical protein
MEITPSTNSDIIILQHLIYKYNIEPSHAPACQKNSAQIQYSFNQASHNLETAQPRSGGAYRHQNGRIKGN